jgi:hypothetical protein
VIDLIRGLLDRPLDPRHARVVVTLAITVTFAFAVLVTFGVIAGSVPNEAEDRGGLLAERPSAPPPTRPGVDEEPSHLAHRDPSSRARHGQDPQDRRGSRDYRRARQEIREHRALQHLPFRQGTLSITLIGAERGRAVIRVDAPTIVEARRGWRSFLGRCHDDGRAYRVTFSTTRSRRG